MQTHHGFGWESLPPSLSTPGQESRNQIKRNSVLAMPSLYTASQVAAMAGTVAGIAAWFKSATQFRLGLNEWSAHRRWTALNVVNHGIYAVLFIIRSLFYTGVGGTDRPFYYESFFLGWLCGPSSMIPTWFGWDNNQYNRIEVLNWVTNANSASSGVFPNWLAQFVGNPMFMYGYQIAEGTFHLMIVAGGLRAFSQQLWSLRKKGDGSQRCFRYGLLLELIIMDITYVIGYSYLPLFSVPGHWGLTTIMMLIHHLNVVPDVVCAFLEWKDDQKVAQKEPMLAMN